MTKVMAKCAWSGCEAVFTAGEMYEVIHEADNRFFAKSNDGRGRYRPWDGKVWKFERIEAGQPPTTIEEMLAVVEAAGANTAVAATQALHAAGYHK